MRTQALHYLACPCCDGLLMADATVTSADGHVMAGTLFSACGARFPIRHGVPRLLRPAQSPAQAPSQAPDPAQAPSIAGAPADGRHEDTAAAPGVDGRRQARVRAQQLLGWLAPLGPSHITGRAVLELGSGCGSNTALIAGHGARDVVAVDAPAYFGGTPERAFAATRHLDNVHVVEGDITRPPVRRVFDLGLALGTLSELPDPARGFAALHGRIRAGGHIALWVHGHAPGPLTSRVVARLRQALEHLSHGLSLRSIGPLLPRELQRMLMDERAELPAHFLHRSEVERLFHSPDLDRVHIAWHQGNAWRASAEVCGHARDRASHTRTPVNVWSDAPSVLPP